jgi:hypothetical protein
MPAMSGSKPTSYYTPQAWPARANVAITLTMALTLAFRRADAGTSMAWRGIVIRAFGGWIAATA